MEGSRIPVIQHLNGVCQLYVDRAADVALAERLCMNAKTQRPGVCNAIENLLVHRDVAAKFHPAFLCQQFGDGLQRPSGKLALGLAD